MKLKYWNITILLLLTLLLTSCGNTQGESLWLKSPGWSRAAFVGTTSVLAPVSIATGSDGDIYFFLVDENEETNNYSFDLAHMDPGTGEIEHFKINPGELQNVKQPEIIRDETGDLRLFWVAGEGLYTLVLGENGVPADDPVLLSGNDAVSSYDIALATDGRITIWYAGSRRNPGVHALSAYDGSVPSGLIDPEGVFVRIRYDLQNQLHVTWAHNPFGYEQSEILYGVYDPGRKTFSIPYSSVILLDLGPLVSLDDFSLGVDDTNIYFSWVKNFHAGPRAGEIQSFYQAFPIGEVNQGRLALSIAVPTIYSLEFDNPSSSMKTGPRVSMAGLDVPMTTKVQDFRTNMKPAEEVVMAVRSPAEHLWRKEREQVNLIYFDNGSLSAYQPLTFTSAVSAFPYVVNDQNGYISIAWLERSSSAPFIVYYSSTDPLAIARFESISGQEYLSITYTVLFGMLIGALLAPIAAGIWLIPPLIVLALFSFVRRLFPPRISEYLSTVGLLAAVGAVWFTKLAVFPMMFEYVPFSAWIPNIPVLLGNILRVGIPWVTLVISGFIAWHFTYRRENSSSLYFILIYVAVEALITTSIYAVLIYGTYVQ